MYKAFSQCLIAQHILIKQNVKLFSSFKLNSQPVRMSLYLFNCLYFHHINLFLKKKIPYSLNFKGWSNNLFFLNNFFIY